MGNEGYKVSSQSPAIQMSDVELGAALIGLVIGAMWVDWNSGFRWKQHWHEHLSLFGITTLQAYQYFIKYSKDALWLKISVSYRSGDQPGSFSSRYPGHSIVSPRYNPSMLLSSHGLFLPHRQFRWCGRCLQDRMVCNIPCLFNHHSLPIQEPQRLVGSTQPNGLLLC